jgi:hypothetical protein
MASRVLVRRKAQLGAIQATKSALLESQSYLPQVV